MIDRISYNSADLEAAASELDRAATAIKQAAGVLSRINTNQEWWSKLNIPGSVHLRGTETTVHFGSASTSLRALKSATDRYSSYAGTLAQATRQAIRLFDDAERENMKTLNSQGGSSNAVFLTKNDVDYSAVLGFPSDRSKWTDKMKKEYDDFVDGLTPVTLDDGSVGYMNDGTLIILDADGKVASSYEISESFSQRTETHKTYDKDGNLVSSYEVSEDFHGRTVTEKTYDKDGNEIYTKSHQEGAIIGVTDTVTKIGEHGSKTEKEKKSFTIDKAGYENKKAEFTYKDKDGKEHTIKPIEQKDLGDRIVKQYDTKTKKWVDATKDEDGSYKKKLAESKRVATIAEVTMAGVSASGSVLSGTASGEYGIASGEITGSVINGEAHANVKAGLYSTKVNADGTTSYVLEPGVSAEAGASYSTLKVEASGQIGGDNLNAFAEGKAEVLSAEAKVGGQAGIVDGKLALGANASAEANLVKAEGDVGVDIAGIKGSVGGSVNVGIGAHAKVGLYDGVFTVDVGASLGVGASVRFNVDVSGFVDNVVGVGKSISKAWKGLTSLF